MRVVVGIPSFNEADTIARVVAIVDQGLSQFAQKQPNLSALIVNADSNSLDGTSTVFRSTSTTWPKLAVSTFGAPGKGKNLLKLLQLPEVQAADGFLTIDADLRSVEPDWISILLAPLIQSAADFVTPRYQRSPYEGSTTNQFAWPLVQCFFGQDVRQPIAGDFAMGQRLISAINQTQPPAGAEFYGVDIFLTLTAVTAHMRIASVELGRKLHKPSHEKLTGMFPQIANTVASFVAKRGAPTKGTKWAASQETSFIASVPFPHSQFATDLISSMLPRARQGCQSNDWLRDLRDEVLPVLHGYDLMSSRIWTSILAYWVRQICISRELNRDWGSELLPFYTIRAASFWLFAQRAGEIAAEADLSYLLTLLSEKMESLFLQAG